jgi:D-alanine-D-alanine ligase-like ATP-grasp enzyme
MTPQSLLPDEAQHAGISYEALVERLLQYALARGSEVRVG